MPTYRTDFAPNEIISATDLNWNMTVLRDNLEVVEDLTSLIDGTSYDFAVANDFQTSTLSLVQVCRNGIVLRQHTSVGDGKDYEFVASNVVRLLDSTGAADAPAVGETLTITYRKKVS